MSQTIPCGHQTYAALPMQTWTVVADGLHNAFTDMLYWQNAFWLVYVSSPSHFASPKSRLVLLRSQNAIDWEEVTRFTGNGQDIRDPKLAIIHERLVLYALLNQKFDPQPYKTICAQSTDGKTWSPLIDITPTGWLLGRPQTPDGSTWYAPAHHIAKGAARLFHSSDGIRWENHAAVYEQELADETALVFSPDGNLLIVTRLESSPGIFGSPQSGTLISTARPPYENLDSQTRSTVTRLDGPNLFFNDQHYAIGRSQSQVSGPFHWQGSIFGRKRTSLFSVNAQGLFHLAALPSCGDTSYAGVVLHDGNVFVSYYTNNPGRDIPWILGMFRPTQIQVTRISLSVLSEYVQQK